MNADLFDAIRIKKKFTDNFPDDCYIVCKLDNYKNTMLIMAMDGRLSWASQDIASTTIKWNVCYPKYYINNCSSKAVHKVVRKMHDGDFDYVADYENFVTNVYDKRAKINRNAIAKDTDVVVSSSDYDMLAEINSKLDRLLELVGE